MKAIPTANALKLSKGFTNEPRREQKPLIKREGGSKVCHEHLFRKKVKQFVVRKRQNFCK